MNGLLDASVIGALLFDDDGAADIGQWITANLSAAVASNFAWGEVVGALGIKVRAGGSNPVSARELLTDFADSVAMWTRIDVTSVDVTCAVDLISDLTLALRLPDAIHVAVARRLGATLVTTDRQQYRAALSLGLPAINPLERSNP